MNATATTPMGDSKEPEVTFLVSVDEIDCGYSASALEYGIHTQAETLDELRHNIREAVDCHFDETMKRPEVVYLRFVRD